MNDWARILAHILKQLDGLANRQQRHCMERAQRGGQLDLQPGLGQLLVLRGYAAPIDASVASAL